MAHAVLEVNHIRDKVAQGERYLLQSPFLPFRGRVKGRNGRFGVGNGFRNDLSHADCSMCT